MADVNIIPKIRCDNCGLIVEKERRGAQFSGPEYTKPRRWGALSIESGRGMQGYPVETLKFIDLCPSCATGAHDAAAARLAELRGEAAETQGG